MLRVLVVGLVLPLLTFAAGGLGVVVAEAGHVGLLVLVVLVTIVLGAMSVYGVFTMFVADPQDVESVAGLGWISAFLLVFALMFDCVLGLSAWMSMADAQVLRCEVLSVDDGEIVSTGDGDYTLYRHVVACPGGYPGAYAVDSRHTGVVDLLVDPEREDTPEDLRGADVLATVALWGGAPTTGLFFVVSLGRAVYWFRTSGPSSRGPAPRS
ncbi:hypothetical protein JOD54_003477 [Actinokineospora baliensis]|uniref:hypothetical protein n=1 Tax=Actinokineospora baliensis TaxID=547056 RepID=UPI00195C9A97|nr:hypothetical protein [Actinokineospora baliensis]MBM7773273.1 hypothetical protein [Actinokineospora baliensis]